MTIFTTQLQRWVDAEPADLVDVSGHVTVSQDGSEWVVVLLGTMDQLNGLTPVEQEEAKDLLTALASKVETEAAQLLPRTFNPAWGCDGCGETVTCHCHGHEDGPELCCICARCDGSGWTDCVGPESAVHS